MQIWKIFFTSLLTGILIVYASEALLFDIYVVKGESMLPTFKPGEWLVVEKLSPGLLFPGKTSGSVKRITPAFKKFKNGEIIAFYPPNGNSLVIKRIRGVSGDKMSINGSALYRNETQIQTWKKISLFDLKAEKEQRKITVPSKTLFVSGDNASVSLDSRHWGPLPVERVMGRVLFTIRK